MILAAFLADWTDIDVAAHELARALGILPERSVMADAKWVYWSNNALGGELYGLLDKLTTLGFLEKRNEPDYQYRLAPQFQSRLGIEEIWDQFAPSQGLGLTLVVVRCTSVDRSRLFYEALGIAFTSEQHGSGPRHYSAQLGDTVLELYPSTETIVPIRLGVSVTSVEAAVAAASAFADCVVRFDPERSPHSALLSDPDRNKIELTGTPPRVARR